MVGDGEALVLWSARLTVACYVARLLVDAWPLADIIRGRQLARWFWTMGCALLVAHTLLAFHFVHGWSHEHAYAHTAKRTAEVTGWAVGSGVYGNYLFALLWVADAARWWIRGDRPDSAGWYWTIQVLFAFMMFFATAVFGPTYWKWVAGLTVIVVGCLAWQSRRTPGTRVPMSVE